METYGNLSGNSWVIGYALGRDRIEVRFRSGWTYVYTHRSAGRVHVETMVRLAVSGRGLASYISQTAAVRHGYASKRPDG